MSEVREIWHYFHYLTGRISSLRTFARVWFASLHTKITTLLGRKLCHLRALHCKPLSWKSALSRKLITKQEDSCLLVVVKFTFLFNLLKVIERVLLQYAILWIPKALSLLWYIDAIKFCRRDWNYTYETQYYESFLQVLWSAVSFRSKSK